MTQTVFSLFGIFESLFGAGTFAFHPGVDTLGVRTDKIMYKTEIIFISHHYICFAYSGEHGRSDILFRFPAQCRLR